MAGEFLTEPLGPYLWDALRGLASSGSARQKKHISDLAKYRATHGQAPAPVTPPRTPANPTPVAPAPAPRPSAAAGPAFTVEPEAPPPPARNVMGAAPAPAPAPGPQQEGNFAGYNGTGDILAASMGLAGGAEEDAALQEQLAQAIALRDTAGPGMRGEGGRVQTAANPLEHLATGMNRMRGYRDEQQTRKEQRTAREDTKAYRKRLMDAIGRQSGVVEADDGLKEPLYGR